MKNTKNFIPMIYTQVPDLPNWTRGSILEYTFCIKHYERGSQYGIDGGRISKLEIRKGNKILANYDRGWDIEPAEETKKAYAAILEKFN